LDCGEPLLKTLEKVMAGVVFEEEEISLVRKIESFGPPPIESSNSSE
jgi:hypothetical protein